MCRLPCKLSRHACSCQGAFNPIKSDTAVRCLTKLFFRNFRLSFHYISEAFACVAFLKKNMGSRNSNNIPLILFESCEAIVRHLKTRQPKLHACTIRRNLGVRCHATSQQLSQSKHSERHHIFSHEVFISTEC